GTEVESYYKAAVMLASMGFDGIDINMGCPANKVAARGSGAGLIRNPELAKRLILITKKAMKDWSEGITLKEAGVHQDIIVASKKMSPKNVKRKLLPVSVKTRIGYDKVVAEEWVKHLLECEPANISMHGRTLKQMYTGRADWDELAKAAKLCKKTKTSFMGNGDVSSMEDAKEKIKKYKLDGVLVGRATMGNPWFFNGKEPSVKDRLKAVLEHTKYFVEFEPNGHFVAIRKHLAWYCKGFEGAKELRVELMKVENLKDVEKIVKNAKITSGKSLLLLPNWG
ncbi:MAG: tRNA-dihydrouridine synthase, partial [Candidatus Gracilibacteria bacterium]